jgi:hypothetical protein
MAANQCRSSSSGVWAPPHGAIADQSWFRGLDWLSVSPATTHGVCAIEIRKAATAAPIWNSTRGRSSALATLGGESQRAPTRASVIARCGKKEARQGLLAFRPSWPGGAPAGSLQLTTHRARRPSVKPMGALADNGSIGRCNASEWASGEVRFHLMPAQGAGPRPRHIALRIEIHGAVATHLAPMVIFRGDEPRGTECAALTFQIATLL